MAGTVDPTLMRKTSRIMGLLICELSVPDFFLNNSLRTATPFNIAFLRYFFLSLLCEFIVLDPSGKMIFILFTYPPKKNNIYYALKICRPCVSFRGYNLA